VWILETSYLIINIITTKSPASQMRSGAFYIIPGGDLLSHTVTHAVPSALRGIYNPVRDGHGSMVFPDGSTNHSSISLVGRKMFDKS